ncbi:hypothetical protein [Nocardioides baculatus]|uniref:PH domain-containing protein n=1 Tax=Nocardioides baculatus TaxID=2801337 RepID=A0ABS1L4E5_9ACTN|nr:hypothetical protein [Nocardioides baculatus]MBL0746560.1 hypothetical protein [Nocardioides baculatus]
MAPSAAEASSTWVELEPRTALVAGCLLVAALCAWPVWRTWRAWRSTHDRRGLALLTAIGCTLIFVGAPLALAADAGTSGVRVSGTRVETTRFGEPRTGVDLADLTSVEVGCEGSLGPLTPGRWDHYVRLTGSTPSGGRIEIEVTTARFESLQPLLDALEPVVRERPGLSTTWGR